MLSYLMLLVWVLAGTSLVIPSPLSSPPLELSTCPQKATRSQMCTSLNRLKNHTLSQANSGECTSSGVCLTLYCTFTTSSLIPIVMNITLLPCTSPFSFGITASSTLLGGELVNGVFSGSSSVPITVFGFNGTVDMTLMQREFGVTVTVAVSFLGNTLPVVPQTDVYMYCAGGCPP